MTCKAKNWSYRTHSLSIKKKIWGTGCHFYMWLFFFQKSICALNVGAVLCVFDLFCGVITQYNR